MTSTSLCSCSWREGSVAAPGGTGDGDIGCTARVCRCLSQYKVPEEPRSFVLPGMTSKRERLSRIPWPRTNTASLPRSWGSPAFNVEKQQSFSKPSPATHPSVFMSGASWTQPVGLHASGLFNLEVLLQKKKTLINWSIIKTLNSSGYFGKTVL